MLELISNLKLRLCNYSLELKVPVLPTPTLKFDRDADPISVQVMSLTKSIVSPINVGDASVTPLVSCMFCGRVENASLHCYYPFVYYIFGGRSRGRKKMVLKNGYGTYHLHL